MLGKGSVLGGREGRRKNLTKDSDAVARNCYMDESLGSQVAYSSWK